jgi:hypothetical protein
MEHFLFLTVVGSNSLSGAKVITRESKASQLLLVSCPFVCVCVFLRLRLLVLVHVCACFGG